MSHYNALFVVNPENDSFPPRSVLALARQVDKLLNSERRMHEVLGDYVDYATVSHVVPVQDLPEWVRDDTEQLFTLDGADLCYEDDLKTVLETHPHHVAVVVDYHI